VRKMHIRVTGDCVFVTSVFFSIKQNRTGSKGET
jgi:hypothetical protein